MASQPRLPLPRLSIPPLSIQQPLIYDNRAPMYSPALPPSVQQSFHPAFPMNGPMALQTPMQSFFHQPPNAPSRAPHAFHAVHPSLVHFAGLPPQSAIPMTPLGQGFPPGMLGSNLPYGQQYIPRNRRTPSVSIGGPPKAPLGGPGRKHSPMPPQPANPTTASSGIKGKKLVVILPREIIPGEDGEPSTRPSWARTPVPYPPSMHPPEPPELVTAEAYPSDLCCHAIPDTIDVFLPGKNAWDVIKQREIEEKLEKLGVERGSGSKIISHVPHARAASISSPADPSLLYYKLNKLQHAQNASIATTPALPLILSPSPNPQLPPRLQGRHGYSLSLAQSSNFQSPFYNPSASFNPFGPSAILGSDQILNEESSSVGIAIPADNGTIHAPQGRVPLTVSSLAPTSISRPTSRPDFTRGFGLDIPEEDEEELQSNNVIDLPGNQHNLVTESEALATEGDAIDSFSAADGALSAAAPSRLHSRHMSRLSHTLSLRSVGGITDGGLPDNALIGPLRSPVGVPDINDLDNEAVGEWTGSEDLRLESEKSDDEESIGEWSNPSDEERARQERRRRRVVRHQNQCELEIPRRLPNFPRPPDTFMLSLPKDDDLLSNPSEENFHSEQNVAYLGHHAAELYTRPSSTSTNGRAPRPLPPLPHSRGASGKFSIHDPALAHSRTPSDQARPSVEHHAPSFPSGSLNPRAKPFVFGASKLSGSWSSETIVLPQVLTLGHARLPSFGKPLNAAAQEFKPGALSKFTFRPPPGIPQLTFPAPELPRPLPVPPVKPSPARAQQGREKRQRRGSRASLNDDDGERSMSSFRFPTVNDSPHSMRRSAPTTPRKLSSNSQDSVEGATQALTFAGFPSAMSISPRESGDTALYQSPVETLPTMPTRPKRAPIPLDFKRPISSNTVPAGLFKALVGDEKTRRTVRSRLSSRELFEQSRRPSLDDLTVPTISRTMSRSRFVTDPVHQMEMSQDSADLFTPALKRRSSLPALNSSRGSSESNVSIPALNLTKRLEVQQYEEKLEALLDEKFRVLQEELSKQGLGDRSINQSTEAMITEVITLFRAQLQESAARGLEDSQMDARGELDLELIKDVVHQGHTESRLLLQAELQDVIHRLDSQIRSVNRDPKAFVPAIEQINSRSLQVIMNAISQLSTKMDTSNSRFFSTQYERESLVKEMMSALTPTIAALRPEPVDYDLLTAQLSQAVKPNISQLIDLASDKRETAVLIVDSLLPILPRLVPAPAVDTNAIIAQITAEVRRVIAPVDAHEIKEHVADLVVERLDSRLAVRDKAFNVDNLSTRVTEAVAVLLEPVEGLDAKLDAILEAQKVSSISSERQPNAYESVLGLLPDLPAQLVAATRALETAKSDYTPLATSDEDDDKYKEITHLIQSIGVKISDGQTLHNGRDDELVSLQKALHKDLIDHLTTLPEALTSAVNSLQVAHAEYAVSREASRHDQEEIRQMKTANTELQVQLAKARGAHGQVRVEKDHFCERLKVCETERDRLGAQVEELQELTKKHASEYSTTESRNRELEDALSQSLARLKASDVTSQSNQERIMELESANREGVDEKQALRAKVESMETRVKILSTEKNATAEALAALQADNEELKELRRLRDRSKVLEGEYAMLQKRFRDQEDRVANNERTAAAARQSLAQAQQRASEWERRAKEYEADLEITRNKLDHAEQAHLQLDADYSLAKLQLEEKDAEERLSKERGNKLKDQVATFEARVARLQTEIQNVKGLAAESNQGYQKPNTAKAQSPPRPDSRASFVLSEDRSGTPVGRMNGFQVVRSDTPPQSSVWDSMHAPKHYPNLAPAGPYPSRPHSYYRPSSPTPSVVSTTPTQGDDGWWA